MTVSEMLDYIYDRCLDDKEDLSFALAYLSDQSIIEVYEELSGDWDNDNL